MQKLLLFLLLLLLRYVLLYLVASLLVSMFNTTTTNSQCGRRKRTGISSNPVNNKKLLSSSLSKISVSIAEFQSCSSSGEREPSLGRHRWKIARFATSWIRIVRPSLHQSKNAPKKSWFRDATKTRSLFFFLLLLLWYYCEYNQHKQSVPTCYHSEQQLKDTNTSYYKKYNGSLNWKLAVVLLLLEDPKQQLRILTNTTSNTNANTSNGHIQQKIGIYFTICCLWSVTINVLIRTIRALWMIFIACGGRKEVPSSKSDSVRSRSKRLAIYEWKHHYVRQPPYQFVFKSYHRLRLLIPCTWNKRHGQLSRFGPSQTQISTNSQWPYTTPRTNSANSGLCIFRTVAVFGRTT